MLMAIEEQNYSVKAITLSMTRNEYLGADADYLQTSDLFPRDRT